MQAQRRERQLCRPSVRAPAPLDSASLSRTQPALMSMSVSLQLHKLTLAEIWKRLRGPPHWKVTCVKGGRGADWLASVLFAKVGSRHASHSIAFALRYFRVVLAFIHSSSLAP